MKVISVKKSQSKVGGEMMKSSLQQKSQHDTIITNILRLQFQYQQQHTSASSYTHNSNTNQYSTRFSKLIPSLPSSSSPSLSTDAPIIAGPTIGQLPSDLENHNPTNAAELRVTHDAILAYDAQLNSEADDLILYYMVLRDSSMDNFRCTEEVPVRAFTMHVKFDAIALWTSSGARRKHVMENENRVEVMVCEKILEEKFSIDNVKT
ncbi:hypothetical protein FRACYDRAFT_255470 [Fragilariopsis cylindrus CCMP1102]|uniref:Uncharacterized protein n=1 Tax=Fragilariopsis cylindrus CCMP1102 TaxID=635003 RepID=A0A1E7EK15_9STRA|nr:hypothetical protein FRACYDRAFT_255470 [Fragilariopsis cylindrus CCMP1102]|eukprot:OEU06250.1 hypothetical protein FRACYDRAFT_255470 [Fragilariopsis cylindrus CCMP1102]